MGLRDWIMPMVMWCLLREVDRDVVLAAVGQDGAVLQFASSELQDDKDVVLAAVAQNPEALQYASSRLCKTVVWYHMCEIYWPMISLFLRGAMNCKILQVLLFAIRRVFMGEIHAYMGIGLSTHSHTECATSSKQLGSEHIE